MKSSLGNPARGEAFYPRDKDIKNIIRTLNSGTSIYLSAPRRVGKTSILKYLEDNQSDEQYYIYVLVESVYSKDEFFSVLCKSILDSKAIKNLKKISTTFNNIITNISNRIESVKGIDIRKQEATNYESLFFDLLKHIKDEKEKVIIMIDEFPQTIINIESEHGNIEARRFIQTIRTLRQNKACEEKVAFIYTGSISLSPIIERVSSLTDINDIRTIKLKPWDRNEANELITELLKGYTISLEASAIEYMLDKIAWYIPFHIQLICDELANVSDEGGTELNEKHIDIAINNTIDIKNKAQFAPYFTRLEGLLKKNEYDFALEILVITAQNSEIAQGIIFDLSIKYNVKNHKLILENLCEDGYLDKGEEIYTYTSPILQMWCLNHI